MAPENPIAGRCYECEFFHDNSCKRMENALSSMTDPICIQKCTLMMIDSIGQMIFNYINDENDDKPVI
jgi:hypothetical protein